MTKKTIIVRRDGKPGAFDACRRLLAVCSISASRHPNLMKMIAEADAELDRLEAERGLALQKIDDLQSELRFKQSDDHSLELSV